MNGHAAYSMAQSRYGVQPVKFDDINQYTGPDSPASLQAANRQSTSFVFRTKQLREGTPLSLSSDTRGDILGSGMQPGMGS